MRTDFKRETRTLYEMFKDEQELNRVRFEALNVTDAGHTPMRGSTYVVDGEAPAAKDTKDFKTQDASPSIEEGPRSRAKVKIATAVNEFTPKRKDFQDDSDEMILDTGVFENRAKKNNPRRDSILDFDFDNSEDTPSSEEDDDTDHFGRRGSIFMQKENSKAGLVTPAIIKTMPPYDHIKLDSLTVKSCLWFATEVAKYQSKYGVRLNAGTLVGTHVRNSIMAKNPEIGDEESFFELDSKTLNIFIQRAVRPPSAAVFLSVLKEAVSFNQSENFKLTLDNFERFYDRAMVYRNQFVIAFDYLTKGASFKKQLRWENKDGTVIKLFIDKLPQNYARRLFNDLQRTRFDGLIDFLNCYFRVMSKHKSDIKRSMEIMNHFVLDTPSRMARDDSNPPDKKPTFNSSRFSRPGDTSRPTRVNNISGDDDADVRVGFHVHDDLDDSLLDSNQPGNECENEWEPFEAVAIAENGSDIVIPSREKSVSFAASSVKQPSNFNQRSAPPSKILPRPQHSGVAMRGSTSSGSAGALGIVNNACLQMILYGKCDRPNCSFSHDATAVRKGAESMMSILSSSPILRSGPKLNAISGLDEDQMQEALNNVMLSILNAVAPESNVWSSVLRHGTILCGTDTVEADRVLFDSGSIHANFISKAFVDRHIDVFGELIVPSSGSARLADDVTKLEYAGSLNLSFVFIDDTGSQHCGTVLCHILPTLSADVIIGLPVIINDFLELFISMLRGACVTPEEQLATVAISDISDTDAVVGELRSPWSRSVHEEAPEDVTAYVPCSFTDVLNFMETGMEEATKNFFDQLHSHVDATFAAATDIINLLKTEGLYVFVPQNWNGIKMQPVELNWKSDMPIKMKPKARPVNPKLFADAEKEFRRLSGYFYRPSTSDRACCLVIAPKATAPWIRFCGDYTPVNNYLECGHYPIPKVQHRIANIIKYRIFLDFDMTNSYHQIPIGDITSKNLSLQTPWGQVEPMFLPEGVTPASGLLQSIVERIFPEEWIIVIFDNILALAHDYTDAYAKTAIVLARCREHNIFLKFTKTWLGFNQVTFFGYVCRHHSYCLSDERKEGINNFQFPDTTKKLRSFLGTANFFASFVPNYSVIVAPLHEMTKKNFVWDETKWKKDYKACFEQFKAAVIAAVAIFYPDYDAEWIIRCDASEIGFGSVFLQRVAVKNTAENSSDDTSFEIQPIMFISSKFSDAAMKWQIYDKEGYAIYYTVHKLQYYLRAKRFVIETDHRNLKWIEQSQNPRVIRWCVFLQGFQFDIKHIPGRTNAVADWQSRLYFVMCGNIDGSDVDNVTHILSQVHSAYTGHHGVKRTWDLLNKHFPGHCIPFATVYEFVSTCAICQKNRLGMNSALKSIVRHLKVDDPRKTVGFDVLTVGEDSYGNKYLHVFRNFFTKFVVLYPVKEHTGEAVVDSILKLISTYGLFDTLATDPGSDIMSSVVEQVNEWLGIHHRISLVDRHQSNGVEGANKDILRHLIAICMEKRLQDKWSRPSIIGWIQLMMNMMDDSETGVSPLALTFGSADSTHFDVPKTLDKKAEAHKYLKLLNEDLQLVRDVSSKFQLELIAKRTADNEDSKQNIYQPGDFVFLRLSTERPKPTKLTPRYMGPYEVISHFKNDVCAKHVVTGRIQTFYVEDLKIFYGTREEAFELAQRDHDQYEISHFVAYRGDPHIRTTVEFLVKFKDDTEVWLPWSDDLFSTVQYEEYCRAHPALFQLIFRLKIAKQMIADILKSPITEVVPNDEVFVDIRSYGADWYATLNLPDLHVKTYVVVYKYISLSRNMRKIRAHCILFDEIFDLDHLFVKEYGSVKTFDSSTMILIDDNFVARFPQVAPDRK